MGSHNYVSELCGTVWNLVDQISWGGILVYNEEDLEVKRVAEAGKQTQISLYNPKL
jgi:hypothetical protein